MLLVLVFPKAALSVCTLITYHQSVISDVQMVTELISYPAQVYLITNTTRSVMYRFTHRNRMSLTACKDHITVYIWYKPLSINTLVWHGKW